MFIGVDIGGTTIKFAVVNGSGDIHLKWQEETKRDYSGDRLPKQIASSIETHTKRANIKKEQILSVGIGAPGPIDSSDGAIASATNLNLPAHYPLQDKLSQFTQLPVSVENDANCAVLGENWVGSARGYQNIVLVTIGTGIGSGMISNGQLLRGHSGSAGELGHTTAVSSDGIQCNCGKWGCLETVASATGMLRIAKEISLNKKAPLDKNLTVENIFHLANANDAICKEVIARTLKPLGITLANVAAILNPEVIIIGGGVSQAGDRLLRPLQTYFNEYLFPEIRRATSLKLATLGNDAGVIGAARGAMKRVTR